MKPTNIESEVLTWADDIDDQTIVQMMNSAQLPFVNKPVALMADAHLGYGVPIGTVLPTRGAIIPSAVGVDIGCGMIAQKLTLKATELDLDAMHDQISRWVPAGQPSKKNKGNGQRPDSWPLKDEQIKLLDQVTDHLGANAGSKAARQFGTLGGGNHFVEVCEDQDGYAWIVLHSGSRGSGKQIADRHIAKAKGLMSDYFIELADPDLAYLVEGTPEFAAYIDGMRWAQDYAAASRSEMLAWCVYAAVNARHERPKDPITDGDEINCHHNYTTMENHHGKNMWVTRKGAISAREGQLGVIPGSMATGSYIVRGLGNPASYTSASHGAGRRMSRNQARKTFSTESLETHMDGIAWNDDAEHLLDEHPEAYKDIEHVMARQADLVEPVARLRTVMNYKGA